MFNKLISSYFKLLKFAVLPGILGGIACFIGPNHHALIKAWIGVVIGFAIQHHYMLPAIKETLKDCDELFEKISDDEE